MAYRRVRATGCCDGGTAPDICCGAAKRYTASRIVTMGADDPWAEAASGTVTPVGFGPGHADPNAKASGAADVLSSILGGLGSALVGGFKGAAAASTAQAQMQALAAQRARQQQTMKMLVIGGVALAAVVMITRRD